jgi:UDP-N-acetylglucosamine--N-acetylmuramyl-(pentapeptide) pyrophosphoryl-undecaprenol N-acetylglucosamine transferase
MPDAPPTVIFAAGGTGGHIFPALAVADALRALHPSIRTVFLASQREIDAQILGATRMEWSAIPARPFIARPGPLLDLAKHWGPAVRGARRALRHPGPALALVTTGGFVAAPAARAARAERIPQVLINLDAVPGRANRLLSRTAARRMTTADAPEVPSDWVRIPPIVRAEAKSSASPQAARLAFGLDPNTPTVLITGGSQGARSINDFMLAVLTHEPGTLRGWQVIHQCGAASPGGESIDHRLQAAYDASGIPAAVMPFIDRMADAWAAAECAIARAGAGNVAEVWANAVPTLFLPYPFHADNHQARNALVLTAPGAARIATDLVDPAKNLAAVGPILRGLVGSQETRDTMRAALRALGPADGAPRAARIIADLIAPRLDHRRTR